jgi:hypothetical protein
MHASDLKGRSLCMHARIVHACRVRPRLPPVGREPSLFPSDGRKVRLKRGEKTRSRGTHTVGLLLGHAAHRHPRQHACMHAFTTIRAMHVNAFSITPSCGHACAQPRHTLSPNLTCASQSTPRTPCQLTLTRAPPAADRLVSHARRRQINRNHSRYKTELCRQFAETGGVCKYGDKCQVGTRASPLCFGPCDARCVEKGNSILLKTACSLDQPRIENIRGWLVCASQVSTLWHGMQPACANHGPPARRRHHLCKHQLLLSLHSVRSLESLDSHTVYV